ncbi:hypothetical protein YC2023_044934 [Brassica napus]
MANEYGIGMGSIMAIVVVAIILLFVPLMMGPVAPPSPPLILVFPLVLLFVFLYLHFTCKAGSGCAYVEFFIPRFYLNGKYTNGTEIKQKYKSIRKYGSN